MLKKLKSKSLKCSFCGTPADKVARLLGGTNCYICDNCVGVCNRILEASPASQGNWAEMDDDALLAALKAAEASVEGARVVLQGLVGELRRREVSWQAIGEALGMSRQAAWERFS